MLRLLSPTPAPSNGPRIAAFEIHTRARTPAYSEYVLTPWFYPLNHLGAEHTGPEGGEGLDLSVE